eukprot:SAG11_NODE_4354_length_1935_cov_3.135621_1_plen_65_part_00
MEVGQEVDVLPEAMARGAVEAAGMSFNAARKKRAGTRGIIAFPPEGGKARVKCALQSLCIRNCL